MTVFLFLLFLVFIGYETIMLMEQATRARRRHRSRKVCEKFRKARQ